MEFDSSSLTAAVSLTTENKVTDAHYKVHCSTINTSAVLQEWLHIDAVFWTFVSNCLLFLDCLDFQIQSRSDEQNVNNTDHFLTGVIMSVLLICVNFVWFYENVFSLKNKK